MAQRQTSSFTLTLLVVLSIIFSLSSQECTNLMCIDLSRIEQQKEKVIQELKRNAYIKIGLVTALGATMSYSCYKFFLEPAKVPAPVAVPAVPVNATNDEFIKKLNEIEKVVLAQKRICDFHGYFDNPSNNWTQWLKSWGKYFGAQYVMIGVGSVVAGSITPFTKYLRMIDRTVDSIIDKVFYDADLNWYLSSHTNLFDLYDQIEQHTDSFIKNADDTTIQNRSYYQTAIINSWNLLIIQLEATLGFMSYKADMLAKESEINGERAYNLVNRLMVQVNEHFSFLQTILHVPNRLQDGGMQLKSKLARIKTVLQESLHSFSAFELLITP